MNSYEGKVDTDRWFPVRLVDSTDLFTPETGKVFGDITCKYGYEAATAETTYTVTTDEWKEQGDGNYWLKIGASEFTSEGKYVIKAECTGCADYNCVVEVRDDNVADMMDDMATLLSRTNANITFTTPVIVDEETIELVEGDAYLDEDGRAISLAWASHGLDLTGATCKLTITDTEDSSATDVTSTGSIDEDGDDATFTFELTGTQTATLNHSTSRYVYDMQVTIIAGAGGTRYVTPARGAVTVLEQYSSNA